MTMHTPPIDRNRSPQAEVARQVRAEGAISLDQACFLVPAANADGHVKPATLLRWILSGKAGARLEAARVGGHWHTSIQAIRRFRDRAGV